MAPFHFLRQKQSIVARLHVVDWYIRFQDDIRNVLLADELPIVLISTFDLETFIKGNHIFKGPQWK